MAKMKKGEIALWTAVAILLALNIWLPRQMRHKYSWERDLSQRYAVDFDRTEKDVKNYIQEYIPDVTDAQIEDWTKSGKLESMVIGKRRMYFHSAAPNLFRIVPELAALKAEKDSSSGLEGHQIIDSQTIPVIEKAVEDNLAAGKPDPYYALPKRMRVTYRLTVPANTLRPGKHLRCWLPYPRSDVGRQTDVKFIEAGVNGVPYSKDKIIFSDPECAHGSLYMEAEAQRWKDVTFYEVFEYVSSGEWHPIDSSKVLPYNTESPEYKEYTAEREKHLIFTERIRRTADSLTAGIENPYLQAKAIYSWIDKTFPWASAREYSTIENIPEYVLSSGHGDCGQVTLLFMTLCRAKGIPTRWQSGFMMHPGDKNLHDWCEAYFEGYGWVPVDQSFGVTPYGGYFFLGGIEPYRMIVNTDFGREMSPAKNYPRSETVDFQRGEVEWEQGNLYFNLWNYDYDIEYL
ncbi:MAG: transglutaminase domain-containing protein [Bacteroidales bacterium]|jgi:transglutaminase-like putative cysteine protease|nr:transglutaminase domain-containing protein [Bacteroidales bacterium]MCI2136450.1 transglutaminase domain-containing protein [Bacteroidales bacterium]MDY6384027.1 transglutaminase domain-containing protein [Bacteroidales bacterium]